MRGQVCCDSGICALGSIIIMHFNLEHPPKSGVKSPRLVTPDLGG